MEFESWIAGVYEKGRRDEIQEERFAKNSHPKFLKK